MFNQVFKYGILETKRNKRASKGLYIAGRLFGMCRLCHYGRVRSGGGTKYR
ncbi:Nuclear prelamin A recognition factor-like protein [Caligus rogercresseyi]|uniref:Nuclear prelamin A recognition factor-like protein n=1 Tax=Caligus rogercresseyi TaxID=217165 RepID=A0A7T8GTR1_CALRO|nr:Nuclear prelamin A recognition factor-like protein [Caligus rogercresseyi]